MLFEVVTLRGSVFAAKEAAAGARKWLDAAISGEVLGMWTSDIGHVGDLTILRAFDDADALAAERHRALADDDAFGSASAGVRLSMECYAPFPFLPDPQPRDYGGVFEIRTYHLVPGGLPGTIAAWRAALERASEYADHLVTAMYALDGDPRITHIWGFSSIEERVDIRRRHYAAGLWPPKGGPERIASATSTIALAEPGLPIS